MSVGETSKSSETEDSAPDPSAVIKDTDSQRVVSSDFSASLEGLNIAWTDSSSQTLDLGVTSGQNSSQLKSRGYPSRVKLNKDRTTQRVLLHEGDKEHPQGLTEGDSYFCVTGKGRSSTRNLVLRRMTHGKIQEYPVLDSDCPTVFKMDWIDNNVRRCGNSDEDVLALLSQCLAAAERGVQRMTWDRVHLSVFGHCGQTEDAQLDIRPRILPAVRGGLSDKVSGLSRTPNSEARVVHRVSPDGTLVKAEPPQTTQKVETPVSLEDVNRKVLESGVAIVPGCRDVRGGLVTVVFCKHSAWEKEKLTFADLARLFLYYYSIPGEETQSKGITIIVDARSTTLPILNTLLETLYTVEASLPGAIYIVHVLADRVAQSLLFRSPVFRPQVNLKIDLVMSIDTLYRFVSQSQLPVILGGSTTLCHHHWVRFRLKLEAFLRKCHQAAKYLVTVSQEMASNDNMPTSVRDAHLLLEQHAEYVKKVLDDPALVDLQSWEEELVDLQEGCEPEITIIPENREGILRADRLLTQVQDTMLKLAELADQRLHKLEQCLQLRKFEEQSSQVISWMSTQGEDILCKQDSLADNLKGIQNQRQKFHKQYQSAMTHVEKGNSILEEASVLGEDGSLEKVTGIKDVSTELKSRMHHFTGRLEDLREKIEDTAQCYQLLDKSYEWALEAMRYVATMKMERDMDVAGIQNLLTNLESYLCKHPPISLQTFDSMLELATKLKNDKLYEQCKVAKCRCVETDQLLKVRQATLRKAKEQLEFETHRCYTAEDMMCASGHKDMSMVWEPRTCMYPPEVVIRRRSYAGKPSSPAYSPAAAAFKDNVRDVNLCEYEDYFFSERGVITEDMSNRVVACIPKGLSESTLRNSRESLKGSQEDVSGSSENLSRDQKSSSLPRELPSANTSTPTSTGCQTQSATNTTLNKHNRPHKKMLRKCMSWATTEDTNECKRGGKTLSMITGSTESLPSLPEEEAIPVTDENGGRKFVWSPVPVNTHLMFRNSRNNPAYQSMADLRTAEEEVKKRRTLSLVMREMIQTERDYVRALQFIIENYIPEIMRDDVPQALRGKRNVIFGNLEKIYEFHSQYFLAELEQCENNPFHVCHCFLAHEAGFYLYALYNKNKPKSDQLMAEYGTSFLRRKQIELGDKMDLSSYLLKPVQRMGKYALLLKQIMKECPETDPDYSELKNALEMVKFQLRHGNDLLAMDSLRACDVNLQEQGRLLRQDEFLVWQGRKKSLRHVFLFEDMVLFSKTKRSSSGHDVYIYKGSFKASDLGLTENPEKTGHKFELWFRKCTMRETYILQARSPEVKNIWTKELSRLLWKQAIKNRELRHAEMASMGIGSKPCLDLKPSKDNINDRFINVSMSRVPRTRNSIAISSFDHLKNSNKRPHSLISLSSTSSSTSSSNQSSGYGVLTPVGLSYDSSYGHIRATPRASTLSSNESGIVADMSSNSIEASPQTPTTPVTPVDACTQTTLKRPPKNKSIETGTSPDSGLSLSLVDGGGTEPMPLSTDV